MDKRCVTPVTRRGATLSRRVALMYILRKTSEVTLREVACAHDIELGGTRMIWQKSRARRRSADDPA